MKLSNLALVFATVALGGSISFAQVPSHPPTGSSPHGGGAGAPPQHGTGGSPHGMGHGSGKSVTTQFVSSCGVEDPSSKASLDYARVGSAWQSVPKGANAPDNYSAVGQVWKDKAGKVRAVIYSDSNAAGDQMQFSRMCFRTDGSLERAQNHYIDIPGCKCSRIVEASYDASGKAVKSNETYYSMPDRDKIAPPAATKKFPKPTIYKSVRELPFNSATAKK
ncbi:MAG TPA: hypothetical protein VEG32_11480 [Clostridia bacterium]|nr:hypothetical protein [Clostridia bacterium]